ncbi:hypothetical protein TeGR_g11121 [Tetraparma gracilis]|uniref:Uncharacterized protein n=1 Tax=Tetraparma gracilis TaxID=2962635 RepID=A0ABQ6NBI6_9STRA|nr:hypothetical protein TeGR_g11121 [Tetraparma gracilis]
MDFDLTFSTLASAPLSASRSAEQKQLSASRVAYANRTRPGYNKRAHSQTQKLPPHPSQPSSKLRPDFLATAPASKVSKLRKTVKRTRGKFSSSPATGAASSSPSPPLSLSPASPQPFTPVPRPLHPNSMSQSDPDPLAGVKEMHESLHGVAPKTRSKTSRAKAARSKSRSRSKSKTTSRRPPSPTSHLPQHASAPAIPIALPPTQSATEVQLTRLILSRDSLISTLQSLPPKLTPSILSSTVDPLISLLRNTTLDLISLVTHWRSLLPNSSSFSKFAPAPAFVFAGQNPLLKMTRDTNFLHSLPALEAHLGLSLLHNPLLAFKNLKEEPATLLGVAKNRGDIVLPPCLRALPKARIASSLACLLDELEKNRVPLAADVDARPLLEPDERVEDLTDEQLLRAAFDSPIRDKSAATSPFAKAKPSRWGNMSSSTRTFGLFGKPASPKSLASGPLPGPGEEATETEIAHTIHMRDVDRACMHAESHVKMLLERLEQQDASEARDGPIYEYFLIWKRHHWKIQNMKEMEERRRRKTLRDCFYSWAGEAYRAIHAQRMAMRALQKKRDFLISSLPQTVQAEMKKDHFIAWRDFKKVLLKVREFRNKHGAKWIGICLGAWMHYTRLEYGVKRIRKIVMVDLIRDTFFMWCRFISLKDYKLGQRYRFRHKLTLAGKKWCGNAFKDWRRFIHMKRRIRHVEKIVRRVRKKHAFEKWMYVITSHRLGMHITMAGLLDKIKSLFKRTPFKKITEDSDSDSDGETIEEMRKRGVFVSEIVYKKERREKKLAKERADAEVGAEKKKEQAKKEEVKKLMGLAEDDDEEEEEEEEEGGEEEKEGDEKEEEVASEHEEEESLRGPSPASSPKRSSRRASRSPKNSPKSKSRKPPSPSPAATDSTGKEVYRPSKQSLMLGVSKKGREIVGNPDHKAAAPAPAPAPPKVSLFARDAAARKINKAVHNYLIRLHAHENFKKQFAAVSRIESWWQRQTSLIFDENPNSKFTYEHFAAALSIQRFFRARVGLFRVVKAERKKSHSAAAFLQSSFRRHSTLKDLAAKHTGAEAIQKQFRRKSMLRKQELLDHDGNNSLHYAVMSANSELLQQLLRKDWDITRTNAKKQNVLHIACMSEHSGAATCVEIILKKLTDINAARLVDGAPLLNFVAATDETGKTPLHHACIRGAKESILLLLEKGAELAAYDNDGKTVLHHAVTNERHKACQSLVDSGFPLDAVDHDGCTPLHIASSKDLWRFGQMLIQGGASVDCVDSACMTSLHTAVASGNNKMAHVLLSAGANPNLVDGIGRAPLHIAVENKDEACVRMLLKSAANVNIQDSDGNTPLHWGAMVDARKCIQCLLEWRADIMMVNSTNQPPSQIAVSNDFGECVRLLQNGNTNAASELDPMSFLMGASPAAPEESTPPVESSARSAGSGSGVWACFGDDENLSMQYPAPASPMPKLFFGGYEGQDVAKGRPHAGILKNKNKNK